MMTKNNEGFVARNAERFNLKNIIDKDWSLRESRMFILNSYLDATIYDCLQPWHSEYTGGGNSSKYIPLSQRRPSVIYRLPEIIVNESVAMLFGEEHFPVVRSEKYENAIEFINWLNKAYNINQLMLSAAYTGSLGSVCILIRVLDGKFFFEVLDTIHLIPIFKQAEPTCLESLYERTKHDGASLITAGYDIKKEDIKEYFFIVREWTDIEEIYYQPIKCSELKNNNDVNFFSTAGLTVDKERTVAHKLGFVPAIWGKNTAKRKGIDGMCTFEGAIDISVEIDYQLSQLGRLLKYNSDPTLVIKNPSVLEGTQLIKGIGSLNLDEKGDAYLLEMSNSSTVAVIEFVRCLREFALEVVRGNRANPDKISALHSGKALQMLNSSLIGLVGEMRICYGDNLLLPFYKMVAAIASNPAYTIKTDVAPPSEQQLNDLDLDWPAWYPPTPQDDMQEAQTILAYAQGGIFSKETGLRKIADDYNVTDIKEEQRKVTKDQEELDIIANKSENKGSQQKSSAGKKSAGQTASGRGTRKTIKGDE